MPSSAHGSARHSAPGIFNHPKPFYLLFAVEMWERFGYYGMQALLVFFLVKKFNLPDAEADRVFSAFAALVYAFICVGGKLGDDLIGNKRCMLIGAFVLAGGYGLLGFDSSSYLYPALGLIISGNALFKANPSALVSKLYEKGDEHVDGAFTLYYMGINIGSFLSMSIAPWVQEQWGWGAAFRLCFYGMLAAIVSYLLFRRLLDGVGSEADERKPTFTALILTVGSAVGIAAVSTFLLMNPIYAHWALYTALVTVSVLVAREILRASHEERGSMIVAVVLMGEAVIFFILYQQMPTSLNLFALRNVTPSLFGMPMQAASFQALNPFWIMVLSPVLAWVYARQAATGTSLSLPAKFSLGMFMCAAGFLVAGVAPLYFEHKGMIAGEWLVLVYGLQSTGELLVSGLGLAMISRLTPERSMGFMMGAWFTSQAVAMLVGGDVAASAAVPEHGALNLVESAHIYGSLFMKIGVATTAAALVTAAITPVLRSRIRE